MAAIVRIFALLLLVACAREVTSPSYQMTHAAPQPSLGQQLVTDGTIRFANFEGGCWALATAEGDYEPYGVPEAIRRDGQNVRVWFHASQAASFCMLGPIVVVDSAVSR